jgi:hypothetical protein
VGHKVKKENSSETGKKRVTDGKRSDRERGEWHNGYRILKTSMSKKN